MKINEILSDEEIEDCIDGSSNITMIREIIDRTQKDQLLDATLFAGWFSDEVSNFIDAEEDSEEWFEADENNYAWGLSIAENINDLLMKKWID